MQTEQIQFQSMGEGDLSLVHTWLNRPHMREFYQREPISLESVRAKYLPRIRREVPTFSHIAYLGGTPFGKIQCYRVKDYPKFAQEIGVNHGISIDLFIGEPAFFGRGLGKRLLKSYLEIVAFPMFPHETSCYICHEVENRVALATSAACGFKFLRNVEEDGASCELLVLQREDFANLA